MAISRMIGARVKRREDPHLIIGAGQYVDDVQLAGTLYAAFVRSPYAHARIGSIDTSAARALPGVRLVWTGEEVRRRLASSIPAGTLSTTQAPPAYWPLPTDKVRHVGEPVAVVVADDRYLARDAVERVEVEWEPLEPVIDPTQVEQGPALHDEYPDNVAFVWTLDPAPEALAAAFAEAEITLSARIEHQRMAGFPLETRAILAAPLGDDLTVWASTQVPHVLKAQLGRALNLPETSVRVLATDVGGGFGPKIQTYPEDFVVPLLALERKAPVKWFAERREDFLTTAHGRGQVHEVEIAADRDGRLRGLKARTLVDLGAFLSQNNGALPRFSVMMMPGVYHIPAFQATMTQVFTNKAPTGAYRGAGRPEGIYTIERVMDLIADATGIDPAEVRRRNYLPSDSLRTASGFVYDSAAYPDNLERALELAGYEQLRTEQAAARARGEIVGVGLANYVEICGMGPSHVFRGSETAPGGWESGVVRLHLTGKVTAITGSAGHGQGHQTTFAQVVADELGIPYEDVEVLQNDTANVPFGRGTFGSRSLVVGGSALVTAARKVKEKATRIAAHLLEANPADLEYVDGRLGVRGTDRSLAIQEVALAAYLAHNLPPGEEPGLEATSYYNPTGFCFPFGTHVAVVRIDPDTGELRLTRYLSVDDVGNVVNPLVVEGQIHGGIAQGAGQALCEGIVYDEDGQLVTGTLMDYNVPKADLFPNFETARTVTTTPVNPLGAKGVGEAGTIGSIPAVVNAVIDALEPFGVTHVNAPLTAEKVWRLIQGMGHEA